MTELKPVDWPALIDELRGKGLTSASIAENIGSSATAVKEWRQGIKSPTHALGEALVNFWIQFTGKPANTIPRAQFG